jgi:hypothetical protein
MGVLLPACQQRMHGDGSRTFDVNNLKQIALAIQNCQDTYKRLPPAWGEFPPRAHASEPQKTARATIHVWLMPFLEADNIFKKLTEKPPKGKNNDKAGRVWLLSELSDAISCYKAWSDGTNSDGTVTIKGTEYGVQNFAANIRVFGPLSGTGAQPGVEPPANSFDGAANLKESFPDGLSNVILFTTRYAQCGSAGATWSQIGTATHGPFGGNGSFFGSNISVSLNVSGDNTSGDPTTFQVQPSPANCNPIYPQTYDTGSLLAAVADGSVRAVSPTISSRTWSRAVIPNDGFALEVDW